MLRDERSSRFMKEVEEHAGAQSKITHGFKKHVGGHGGGQLAFTGLKKGDVLYDPNGGNETRTAKRGAEDPDVVTEDAKAAAGCFVLKEEDASNVQSLRSLCTEMNYKRRQPNIIHTSWQDAAPANQVHAYKFIRDLVNVACSRICPGDAENMCADVLHGLEPAPKTVEDKLLRTVGSMANCLPRESTQKRVLLAALCSSQTRANAEKYAGVGRKLYTRARNDAGFVALGHDIEKPAITRQNYKKDVVEHCVRDMLLHTDQESWGQTLYHIPGLVTPVITSTKDVLWDPGQDNSVYMPRLRREAGMNESYRTYKLSCGEGDKTVGECAHAQLLHVVTASQRKARAGVNYVEGNHLHDPLEKLYCIAKETPTWDAKLKLGGVRYFLKSEYLHRHACYLWLVSISL